MTTQTTILSTNDAIGVTGIDVNGNNYTVGGVYNVADLNESLRKISHKNGGVWQAEDESMIIHVRTSREDVGTVRVTEMAEDESMIIHVRTSREDVGTVRVTEIAIFIRASFVANRTEK